MYIEQQAVTHWGSAAISFAHSLSIDFWLVVWYNMDKKYNISQNGQEAQKGMVIQWN